MAIDSYSLCPGGRGKKIRFCCPDHVKDLEQIDKMLEGEQYAAGLAFVENLEKQRPNCACLTEAKCLFQRMIGLWEQGYETAKDFVSREPKNIVAQTELATFAALLNNPQEAVSALIDALESVEGEQFPMAIVQAMLTVGMSLYENGRIFEAVAIAKQLQAFAPQDKSSNTFLYRCLGSDAVPLMLKELSFDLKAPEDFPKKKEYDDAVAFIARGQWKKGRSILESLLDLAGQWPNLFRNIGIVEYWFANEEKGRAYLEQFLATPGIDRETAIDVEQLLLLLTTPTWDDVQHMIKRVYTIDDFDGVFEKFLSSPVLVANPRIQALPQEDDVPPKMAFSVLNRPMSDKVEGVKLDEIARQSGYMFVFGKTTTRAARAEFYFFPEETETVENALTVSLGKTLALEKEEELRDQPVLWTTNASTPRLQFKDPSKLDNETLESVFDEAFREFGLKWFEHKYASLGDKSPKEVLATENGDRRVEALIRVVVGLFTAPYNAKVALLLREVTGLPAPEPIVPPESFASAEDAADFFHKVPLWRWDRLQVEKCNVDSLAELLQIANLVAPREVKEKFAAEFVKRSAEGQRYEDRAIAYSILIDAAILSQDSDKALALIAEAGKYAHEVGQSDSQWNVLEIMTRFRRQEFEKVRALAQHVFAEHQDDREAIQTLQQFFAELNASAQMQARAAEAYRLRAGQTVQNASPASGIGAGSGLAAGLGSQNSEEKSSGLWTPDSDKNSGSQNGGSKLWIPD
ncbi:MAG: hypothetical protein II561_06055 [Thermoguttaceae bacterium]|nr:hypothetical protein [Thermoguttaceae bacterium]